jgi:energy-converting hydrogenase Eha subunit C
MVFVPVRRRLSPSLTDGRRRGCFLPSCCCCQGLRVGRRISNCSTAAKNLFSLSVVHLGFLPFVSGSRYLSPAIQGCLLVRRNIEFPESFSSLSVVHLGFLPVVSGSRYLSPAIQGCLLVRRNIEFPESFSSSVCFCSEILARRKNQREREREIHTQIIVIVLLK